MTDSMKAAYIQKAGAANSIIFGSLPQPELSSNQVLVKVNAVAVDQIDIYLRSGKYPIERSFPYILGHDMCGIVEKVGSEVTNFHPGQRVWTNSQGVKGRQGTFCEFVAIDDNLLYHLPAGIDEKQAVAILHSSATALHGLIRVGKLHWNETIFINGASGSVGSAVLQYSVLRGAKVIAAVGNDDKVQWCKQLGAQHVFNYNTVDAETEVARLAPGGIDFFWDTSRKPNLELAIKLMAPQGRIVLMSGSGNNASLSIGPFYQKELSLLGFTVNNAQPSELKGYADITNQALKEHKIIGRIAETLPLAEAAKAHQLVEDNKNLWGKIVLTL